MALRALNRTTKREAHYATTQFSEIHYLPKAPKDAPGNKTTALALTQGNHFADGSGGAEPKGKSREAAAVVVVAAVTAARPVAARKVVANKEEIVTMPMRPGMTVLGKLQHRIACI